MLIGVVGLSIYPYHMYFHYTVPVYSDHQLPFLLAYALWPVWGSMIAWGLATVQTARIRSLTPPIAALAPLFLVIPAAVETYREPITDAGTTPYISNWAPPAGPLDVVARTLAEHPFVLLGSTLFLLLGVAWARGDRGWLAAGVLGLSLYGGIHGVVEPAVSLGFVLSPLRAAIPGAILFYAGYRLAAETNEGIELSDDVTRSGMDSAAS